MLKTYIGGFMKKMLVFCLACLFSISLFGNGDMAGYAIAMVKVGKNLDCVIVEMCQEANYSPSDKELLLMPELVGMMIENGDCSGDQACEKLLKESSCENLNVKEYIKKDEFKKRIAFMKKREISSCLLDLVK